MPLSLAINPHGRPFVEHATEEPSGPSPASKRIAAAFAEDPWDGLLHLATAELQTQLTPDFAFARDFAREYLTRVCQTPGLEEGAALPPLAPPGPEELAMRAMQAPPMRGAEYLTADALALWWGELDTRVRAEVQKTSGGVQAWLRERNPLWRLVGRVTFHLAENKRDPESPFAFMASYASRLSTQGRVQSLPLGRALQEYAGQKNKDKLLSLLTPIQRAAERSALVKELVDTGAVYHPMAWSPREAYRFLQEIPLLEESGLIVRVPDWWKPKAPPRPIVSVKIGDAAKSKVGVDALLDFDIGVTLDGEALTQAELDAILASTGGLAQLKGKWVEVDREKLAAALEHWKKVEHDARHGGISFFEGMRLLSGAPLAGDVAAAQPEAAAAWVGISASPALEETLRKLRDPDSLSHAPPPSLRAQLRPYQQAGVGWLRFMTQLGLGACLADDMGLGKTIQVITLLLHLKEKALGGGGPDLGNSKLEIRSSKDVRTSNLEVDSNFEIRGSKFSKSQPSPLSTGEKGSEVPPSLLVVPASLIGNWKTEIARFAPSLSFFIAHPAEMPSGKFDPVEGLRGRDLVITTYTMLTRLEWIAPQTWNLVILDEAQAIKNSGTRQTKAVKLLQCAGRVALTGTPIENRLSDLWSLFDFLNPGLLGGAKAFQKFAKELAARTENQYAPLRTLVRPYILRRMKTDKRIIADLPEKTEVNAFCGLSKVQAVLYQEAVRDLEDNLQNADGIQRRGIVLASLMRLKQICNHPSQLTGDGVYAPEQSGKFQRLAELCEELAERQEKALIFTQFREITAALAEFLEKIFGRPGLILHGQTPVGKRRELVDAFQRDEGPPFFVLSLKAGGTGLNLTAASHVMHFDRWWNPAVENQATDRAFRIGQKRNVLVHKFLCRGTVEDRIDDLIRQKAGMANDLLSDAGGEVMLTEMNNDQLLKFVSLDISRAMEG